jgi:CheY-like chemotaxis protein
VFSNLLNNAAKFTDTGGHITVTAHRQEDDVVVSIRDNGRGIDPEMVPRVFDLFSQADQSVGRSREGLGIGLSLVKGLVELHGGSVRVSSAGPGQGSEFTVRLPLTARPSHAEPPVARDEPTSAPRRILIADDSRDNADSLAMLLRTMGHDVRTAYDGEEAVQTASSWRPDAALLDIGMPKVNGYDAARRIREQPWGQGMLLIAVTGWGQGEDRKRTEAAGFDHHLVKPVDPAGLTTVLAALPSEGISAAG